MDWEGRVNGGDCNLTSSSSSSGCTSMSAGGGTTYIQHTVSKFDTLAGVAIRYGVEVDSFFFFFSIIFFFTTSLHI